MWQAWGSTSHSWCSGPTAILPEKVLGVEPLLPGWEQFKIQPNLYDLDWAEGVIPSVAGDIRVKLKRLMKGNIDRGMQIKAVVPVYTTSKIYIPIRPGEHFVIYVNGDNIWENGTFTANNNMISYDSKSDDFIVIVFKPGSYEINAVNEDI